MARTQESETDAADDALPSAPAPRTAVVTGAASGLGLHVAMHLLALGWRVACVDRDSEALGARIDYPEAIPIAADVTDPGSVDRMAAEVEARLGTVALFVPSAGVSGPVDMERTSAAAWRAVVDVNLNGVFATTAALLPLIRAAESARIVFIGSISGHKPRPYLMAYRASKAGLLMFMHCLALQEGPAVRVNAISPGPIMTPMQAGIIEQHVSGTGESASDYSARRIQGIPMRRYATPEDVTGALDFLISSAADFVTGQEIILDGGEYPVL